MADRVTFELVSPERLLLSQAADMVVVPGAEGDFGVLPGHAPFLSSLRAGIIDVYEAGQVTARIFVAGGFAQVSDDLCVVLAEEAEPLEDIDRASLETRVRELRQDAGEARDDAERAEVADLLGAAEAKLTVLDQSRR